MGYLTACVGTAVELTESRRLWQWTEAFTLNEVSQQGCGEASRISEPVPEILLTQAVEVIPCSETAKLNLTRSRNGYQKVSTDSDEVG